jgi:uncharacterized membrane protein
MNRSVRFLGHPVHQMLVVFPAGLLLSSFVLDAAYLVWRSDRFIAVAYWLLAGGLLGAALAAPFGFMDWRRLPQPSRARRVGALHGLGNGVAALLFLGSWLLRTEDAPAPWIALLTSLLAGGLMFITAWLGGELVSRLAVGVYQDAHVDASNSLTVSEATPSPLHPGSLDRPAQAPPLQARHTPQGPPSLSVAGEEDPGAAIDSTVPLPRRDARRRRKP